MCYDRSLEETRLRKTFNLHGMRQVAIPGAREPENSFLLTDMSVMYKIYDALSLSEDIAIVPNSGTFENGTMVSLGLDTVGEDGLPTRKIDESGYTLRSRAGFTSEAKAPYSHIDWSVKSAEKTIHRKEWESPNEGGRFNMDYARLLAENPSLPAVFSEIDTADLRVSSVCLTSRYMYSLKHDMPEHGITLFYDMCNDACVFTTPHADAPVGYRRELEAEVKKVFVNRDISEEELNHLITISLSRMQDKIETAALGEASYTDKSKLKDAQDHVAAYYERRFQGELAEMGQNGEDHALAQNIRPEDFHHKTKLQNLSKLFSMIPHAKDLNPEDRTQVFDDHFPNLEQPRIRLVS